MESLNIICELTKSPGRASQISLSTFLIQTVFSRNCVAEKAQFYQTLGAIWWNTLLPQVERNQPPEFLVMYINMCTWILKPRSLRLKQTEDKMSYFELWVIIPSVLQCHGQGNTCLCHLEKLLSVSSNIKSIVSISYCFPLRYSWIAQRLLRTQFHKTTGLNVSHTINNIEFLMQRESKKAGKYFSFHSWQG